MAQGPDEKSCIDGRDNHCLHAEDFTHAFYCGRHAEHRDDYCCFCGEKFCYTRSTLEPSAHGAHLKK